MISGKRERFRERDGRVLEQTFFCFRWDDVRRPTIKAGEGGVFERARAEARAITLLGLFGLDPCVVSVLISVISDS